MSSKTLALLAALAVGVTACEKDDPAPPDGPTPGTGTVKLGFTFVNGTSPFTMDSIAHDGAGTPVKFTDLRFYVSDIHLTDDASVQVGEFHDTYMLVDAAASTNLLTLGTINETHIHEVHIVLGLDSATNHADPTLAEAPLNDATMHWNWMPSEGYLFLKMEGKVDGNNDGDFDDVEDVSFEYHCATDDLAGETEFHYHADLDAGGTAVLAAKVDVATLLTGLDLETAPIQHGDEAGNVTAMQNLAAAISGE